jgi:lysophospholipase L1-like esterase/pimeloyl-ACP methyl ester carboxylesterase
MVRVPAVLAVLSSLVFGTGAMSQEFQSPVDVSFLAELDGTEQRYVVLLPTGFDTDVPHDVMIALHGHGSDRWQFVNDKRPECQGARDAALSQNMIFVSPDYRAKTSWMGPAAEADLLQIQDELNRRYRIRDVVVCGGSMGGTAALTYAALHPNGVDAVVALNGTANLLEYPNFTEAIAESFGGTKTDKPDVYRERSAEFFPERLTMPVAFTTGGKDTLVPPESTLRLFEKLKQQGSPVLSIHKADGGHETNEVDTVAAFTFVFDQLDAKRAARTPPALSTFDKDTTIVCLGDSVTGVYYHTGGYRAYPEMLELGLRKAHPTASIRVVNAGISGHTTSDGLARLEQDVLQHHPDLVTISFGLNDMTRVPPDQFRTNLEQLIDRCRAQQSLVMLCTPNAVIHTESRPIPRLIDYCRIIREVGQTKEVPVCDQFAAGERLKVRAPKTWRLTMSDEIHLNMDGHKRMAEELCRSISGAEVSLDSIVPPPALVRTRVQLTGGNTLKIVAMEPIAAFVQSAIQQQQADSKLEVIPWPITGKSLSELEQSAKDLVRAAKPDLVVLMIPANETTDFEASVHAISWLMNWSLSFGHQEWDCIVVHPSVVDPMTDPERGTLIRHLVHAQHLDLIDRQPGDTAAAEAIVKAWFRDHIGK